MTPAQYLETLVSERTSKKYPKMTADIEERIRYELDIINTKGYSTYFLIVQDFVNWAKITALASDPARDLPQGL